MSQYYGSMQGDRGEVTRRGTKNSGLRGHIRGWYLGANVEMHWNEEEQRDELYIYITGGSNHPSSYDMVSKYTVINNTVTRLDE